MYYTTITLHNRCVVATTSGEEEDDEYIELIGISNRLEGNSPRTSLHKDQHETFQKFNRLVLLIIIDNRYRFLLQYIP